MTELQRPLDNAVLDALRESIGDDREFLAELIDTFVEDAPGQLESLRGSAASGDADGARRAAHTLKGSSLTFGAKELASLDARPHRFKFATAWAGEKAAYRAPVSSRPSSTTSSPARGPRRWRESRPRGRFRRRTLCPLRVTG